MTRPPSRARRALLALTALLTTGLAVLTPAVLAPTASAVPAAVPAAVPLSAPASQQQTFGIQPASATGPDQRTAFDYGTTPGAQLKDHVAVYNYGDAPLTLTVYAADAFNTSTGGYDVLPASGHSTDVGAWVHLAAGSVTLPPRTREIIPFTLAVPASAAPGDHSGGIVLALRRHEVDSKGNDIAVDQRVGTRIHLRVPGALRPHLAVESVAVHYRGTLNPFGTGTTTVSYTVRNTGNIRLSGRQTIRVRNAVGGVVTAGGPGALTELLPGNVETYTVQVKGVFPTLWSTASITVDPLAVAGDTDPALPSTISNHVYVTVPWTLVALVLVVLALAVMFFLNLRRRRRQGHAGFYTPPVPPMTPPGSPGMPAPQAPSAPPGTGEPAAPSPATPSPETPSPDPSVPVAVPVAVPVPVVTGTPDESGSEAGDTPAAVATRSVRRRTVARLGALALAVVAACVGLLGGASAAMADGASASPSAGASAGAGATADSASGTLYFNYASGHDDDPIDVATSGRCPGQSAWLSASITGPGFPAGGASALGLSAASIYPAASTGGYVVPLDQTLRTVARQNGVSAMHGSYRVDVYCRGRFQPAHLRDFVGTLTFAKPGSWTAAHSTPVAMPESSEPPMTAAPHPAPTTASGTGGGTSTISVLAMVAGALLLVGLGASALRRRRARVLVERKASRVAKKTAAEQPDDAEQEYAAEEYDEQPDAQPTAETKAAHR